MKQGPSPDRKTPLLGIETSGAVGSVALLLPDGSDETLSFEKGLIHGVALAPSVAELLERAGLAIGDLAAVGVGCGPGSYTGTRVGVSFAKSLACAAGLPVVGVSSLEAMAAAAPVGSVVVCARDARRETIYLGIYDRGSAGPVCRTPERLIGIAEARGLLPAGAIVIGDATERYPEVLSGEGRTFDDGALREASAVEVAHLALRDFASRGPDDPHGLAPRYLRPTEAEERMDSRPNPAPDERT